MNDVLDAISARIKAPYFGYALLAFIAMNWRGIFLLATTDGKPEARLAAFDAVTSTGSLIVYPLLVGAVVAASSAWVRLIFEFISRKPLETIDNLIIESEHRKTILKTKLERSRTSYFAEKEEELIDRAKRDFEVRAIADAELRQRLIREIDELRQERDSMPGAGQIKTTDHQLTAPEAELLRAAAKSGKGMIKRIEHLGGRIIEIGSVYYGDESPRDFAKYDSALRSLLSKELLVSMGNGGALFELTNSGWQLADTL